MQDFIKLLSNKSPAWNVWTLRRSMRYQHMLHQYADRCYTCGTPFQTFHEKFSFTIWKRIILLVQFQPCYQTNNSQSYQKYHKPFKLKKNKVKLVDFNFENKINKLYIFIQKTGWALDRCHSWFRLPECVLSTSKTRYQALEVVS